MTSQIEMGEWIIQSETYASRQYIVRINDEICECQLRCPACNICVHNMSCTCLDAVLRSTICKHVHYVCLKYECNSEAVIRIQPEETLEYFEELLATSSTPDSLEYEKKNCQAQIDILLGELLTCEDITAVATATNQLKVINSTIRASKVIGTTKLQTKHIYPETEILLN